MELQGIDPLYFVKRQVIAIVVGLIVMVGLMLIDYRRLRELSLIGYAATVFMLIVVLKFGVSVKGAQARFDIGAFQIQPGEFAKIFLHPRARGVLHDSPGGDERPPATRRARDLRGADGPHHAPARPRYRSGADGDGLHDPDDGRGHAPGIWW